MDKILAFLPLLLPVIAILGIILIPRFTSEKELFKISWDKLAQFVAFLMCLSVFRLLQYDFMLSMGIIKSIPQAPPEITGQMWTLGLVFWEDFFFAVPIYFMMKYMKNKWLRVALIVALSIVFGLGHMYQGWQACVLLAFMPYFVTYNYGKKFGFGTTMLAHILYDVFTLSLVKILPYLL